MILNLLCTSKTGKRLHILQGHSRPITCMLVLNKHQDIASDDPSLLLLTGSSDKMICVSLIYIQLHSVL